jgi:site-specific recombinase XerD
MWGLIWGRAGHSGSHNPEGGGRLRGRAAKSARRDHPARRAGHRPDNPAERLRTLRTNGDYSPTIGLSAEQAKALLRASVGDDLPALRDRALLALMLRNGLRAAEAVGLCVGDL